VSSRAKAMIENVGANLLGVVLNNLNVARDYYYYYNSYYNYSYGKTRDRRDERDAKAVKPPSGGVVGKG
jgi:Mrp family chromosome partitioning ATPase